MKEKQQQRRYGRPRHSDRPKLFSTTIPESVYALLCEIAEIQRRPKSEVLTDAIRAYARHIGLV